MKLHHSSDLLFSGMRPLCVAKDAVLPNLHTYYCADDYMSAFRQVLIVELVLLIHTSCGWGFFLQYPQDFGIDIA